MTGTGLSASAQLAALAAHELALMSAEAFEDLEAVHLRRVALLDALPPVLEADDREHLQTAARTQAVVAEAMRRRRDELAAQLSHQHHARRAAAGYRASAQS